MTSSTTQIPTVESSAVISTARFADKVVLVTGASDRGIGGAIVERVAREGGIVCIASRSEPRRLRKLLDRLECDSLWTECDVTQPDQIRKSVDAVLDEFGKISVLVNNAGVEVARRLEDFSDEQLGEILDVNLRGAIQMSRIALPHICEQGGVIVNVASALGLGGCSGFAVYSASKAGLIGFTQSLAWELAPRGIRVVGVAPGLVHTPMIHKHVSQLTPEMMKRIEACHPLGVGMPQDVAAAVTFLASDDARWITGVTLPLGWAPNYPLPTEAFLS